MHFTIEWLLILILSLYLIYGYFNNKHINSKIIDFSFLCFSLLYIILCFKLKDNTSFDLYRHNGDIKYFRSITFLEAIKDIFTKVNFLWYLYIYMISFIKIPNILPVITMCICFPLFYFLNLKNNNDIKNKILSLFIFFSIINCTHFMSGIRNYLAVTIFYYGIYIYKKNKILGSIISITSLFIHPMTIIFIIFYCINKVLCKISFSKFLLLIWKPICYLILFTVKLVPVKIFELYYIKLYNELHLKFGIDYRIFIFEIIQIVILIFYNERNDKKNDSINYLNYFILGSISLPNIFIRSRFLEGYSFSKIFYNNKYLNYLLLFVSFIIFFYYNYFMMMNGIY